MSTRAPLTEAQLVELQSRYPALPHEYFRYLREVGWGETESGRMIYQGPMAPGEIYGSRYRDSEVLVVGDDMQGYCFGFDRTSGRWGEIDDSGRWAPWREGRPFSDYVNDQEV